MLSSLNTDTLPVDVPDFQTAAGIDSGPICMTLLDEAETL